MILHFKYLTICVKNLLQTQYLNNAGSKKSYSLTEAGMWWYLQCDWWKMCITLKIMAFSSELSFYSFLVLPMKTHTLQNLVWPQQTNTLAMPLAGERKQSKWVANWRWERVRFCPIFFFKSLGMTSLEVAT